jgi:Flp pilus assembly protein CpaB
VVLALGAGGASFYLINNAQQQAGQSGLKYATAVVAVRPIPARKPIEADDVTLRKDIPLDGTNAAGIISDVSKVVGRMLAVDVGSGQLVTSNLLVSSTAGGQFSILKPDETVGPDSEAWRAVSITVSDDRAVGGMLGPGMTVDVFITATVNVPQVLPGAAPSATPAASGSPGASASPGVNDYYTDRSTKITYQNMLILSREGSMYIVKASLIVAEEISHLQAAGNALFSMVLRPDQDTRTLDVSALGATTNRIIERYGLPIPQNYPSLNGPLPTPPPIPPITPPPSFAPSAGPSGSPGASAAPTPKPSG